MKSINPAFSKLQHFKTIADNFLASYYNNNKIDIYVNISNMKFELFF